MESFINVYVSWEAGVFLIIFFLIILNDLVRWRKLAYKVSGTNRNLVKEVQKMRSQCHMDDV